MKIYLSLILIMLLISSCSKDNKNLNTDNTANVGVLEIAGEYQMNYGPHDLAVSDNYVFACRDDIISVIDLSDVTLPTLAATINDVEASNDFEALFINGNTLFAACTSEFAIYVYDITNPENPTKLSKFNNELSSGNPLKILSLFESNNILWITGSNGTSGLIAKLNVSSLTNISIEDYYILSGTGNAGGGIWANSTHAFISTSNGKVYSFNAYNLAFGFLDEYTFSNEAGHEHWGKTLIGNGSKLYWADWGAGLATLNIQDPTNISVENIITNTTYTSEFPNAEGTDVYDLVLDNDASNIYVANGWSGLLSVKTDNTASVDNYVDYKENLYYCVALYGNYALLGDVSTGITNKSGIKIIKLKGISKNYFFRCRDLTQI